MVRQEYIKGTGRFACDSSSDGIPTVKANCKTLIVTLYGLVSRPEQLRFEDELKPQSQTLGQIFHEGKKSN